jgi:hypothetical protein
MQAGKVASRRDLDFALRTPEEDPCVVLDMLVEAVRDLSVGPYRFGVQERRGKPHVTIDSSLGSVDTLRCKLDVNPPPWLATERRGWVPLPIHERYGGPLPELHVVRLEENLAEKIARLNRVTPARDAYDLVWILEHRRGLTRPLDLDLVRHLAVMKTWVDMHGLECSQHVWKRVHEPRPFDIGRWLRPRTQREFDDETIGLLTSPPPSLGALGDALVREFGFLRNLTLEETALARCRGGDRALLLHALDKLPDTQMAVGTCW